MLQNEVRAQKIWGCATADGKEKGWGSLVKDKSILQLAAMAAATCEHTKIYL